MPEGDTIFRAAATLRGALRGRILTRFDAPRLQGRHPAAGAEVLDVEPRGKHLLIHFGPTTDTPPLTLRTHLRMTGSWHVYRPGDRWLRSPRQARVVVEVPGALAVCFNVPEVELIATADLDRHRGLARLGPDLSQPDPDLAEAVRRFHVLDPSVEVGVALLDQRVACGVGNVYKSEALFACRVDPFARVADLDDEVRRALLTTAHRQLRANLDGGRRRTVPLGLAVYGRAGRPCRTCATRIEARRQGEHARLTYWCPNCQRPA